MKQSIILLVGDNKKLFLSPHLEILEKFLYLEKTQKISIIANRLAMLLELFRKKKPKNFYHSNAVGDALNDFFNIWGPYHL